MSLRRRMAAELLGTFWLVLVGCGSAVLAAGAPGIGIGWLGVSLAFGLALFTMAYAIGHISGCHINPAVTVGLWVGGRFRGSEILPYWIAQLAGGILAATVLLAIASGSPDFDLATSGLAANGYGVHSPGGYALPAAVVAEVALTFLFVTVILGSTDARAPAGPGPLACGLALTAVHLAGIPVTNMSVNPARSTGPALFVGGWALAQLWLFWLGPIAGAVLAGLSWRRLTGEESTA